MVGRRVLAVLLAMALAVAACGGDDDGGDDGAAAPAGTARAQLDWALSSGGTATDAELEEHFDEAFLDEVPADDIRDVLANLDGATVTTETSTRGNELVAVVTDDIGVAFTATVVVRSEAPHRIAGLTFTQAELPDAPTSWDEVDERLGALADRGSVLAAEVADDGTLEAVHERDVDAIAPLGSIFKLYVLGALVEAVRAGELAWDDDVAVEERDLSITGGRETHPGATLTLQELAKLMISQSDNPANDVIMRTVGREAVEAMLQPMGMGAASRARTLPFLTARETFIVKWGSRAAEYAKAGEAERRVILAELDEPVPDPFTIDQTKPAEIDRVEWFATADELVAAHLWLDAVRTGPDGDELDDILGSDNPGLVLDPGTWPRGAFKGGSEPGVLALSWLLERSDGRRFVAVMLTSSPSKPIDESEGAAIGHGIIDLLAQLP